MRRKLVAAVRRTLWLQLLAESIGCVACDLPLPEPRRRTRRPRLTCPGRNGYGHDPECQATYHALWKMVDRQARRIVAGLEPMPTTAPQPPWEKAA